MALPLMLAAALSGGIFGDHASPISDTTVLASMAAATDHIDHVRTQLPYALVVGIAALFVCSLPVAYGLSWWVGLPVAALLLVISLWAAPRAAALSDSLLEEALRRAGRGRFPRIPMTGG